MVEKIQDLNLPIAVVGRIIKDALPDGINISKEVKSAIARAASVFVIYLTSAATAEAKKTNHKTITPNHIFDALEEIEFESFMEPLKESLELYRKTVKDKKDSKQLTSTTDPKKKDKKDEDDDDSGPIELEDD